MSYRLQQIQGKSFQQNFDDFRTYLGRDMFESELISLQTLLQNCMKAKMIEGEDELEVYKLYHYLHMHTMNSCLSLGHCDYEHYIELTADEFVRYQETKIKKELSSEEKAELTDLFLTVKNKSTRTILGIIELEHYLMRLRWDEKMGFGGHIYADPIPPRLAIDYLRLRLYLPLEKALDYVEERIERKLLTREREAYTKVHYSHLGLGDSTEIILKKIEERLKRPLTNKEIDELTMLHKKVLVHGADSMWDNTQEDYDMRKYIDLLFNFEFLKRIEEGDIIDIFNCHRQELIEWAQKITGRELTNNQIDNLRSFGTTTLWYRTRRTYDVFNELQPLLDCIEGLKRGDNYCQCKRKKTINVQDLTADFYFAEIEKELNRKLTDSEKAKLRELYTPIMNHDHNSMLHFDWEEFKEMDKFTQYRYSLE